MQIIVKKLRQYKGLTLMELSQRSGLSKSTIQRIENEEVSPNMNQMEALANALEIKIEHLCEPKYTF